MAKGNPIIGNQRGSIGDVTLSVYRGTQVSKKRNRSPRNPKTTPQMLQRMCMAQATRLGAFFASFIDHSWQGKQYGGISRNYFTKRAVEKIRLDALAGYNDGDDLWLYQPKSFPYAAMHEVPFSEGTLLPLKAVVPESGSQTNMGFAAPYLDVDTSGSEATTSAEHLFEALGIPAGGQLTLITVVSNGEVSVNGGIDGENSRQFMPLPVYGAIRLRINAAAANTVPLEFDTELGRNELEAAGFMVEYEGAATGLSLFLHYDETTETGAVIYDTLIEDGVGKSAIAIVGISSLYENGKWLRSTQSLIVTGDMTNFANALNSWTESNASVLNTSRLLNYEGLVNP